MISYRNTPDRPEELFCALGHPIRRKIVECLAKSGPMPAKRIAIQINAQINTRTGKLISLQLFLKHLKILEKKNIIRNTKQGRLHWCELGNRSIEQMIESLALQNYFWQDSVDRFESKENPENS